MKENKYDDEQFFAKYSQMDRSVKGLAGAGEWEDFVKILPDFKNQAILDLGCGFGWHCLYMAEKGAKKVVGVDLSHKMIAKAQEKNIYPDIISYYEQAIEDLDFSHASFDIVFSSLTFHYIKNFAKLCQQIANFLTPEGYFIFSVEHPIFTAQGQEDWCYDEKQNIRHWPVDNYFVEQKRETSFLQETVIKYHRTIMTYLNDVFNAGFVLEKVIEPQPSVKLQKLEIMKNEFRRPMMLIIKAKLKK